MSKYELRPRDVEAYQITSWETAEQIATWCGGRVVEEIDPADSSKRIPGLNVPTLAGTERASMGDYVIRHESGAFQKRSRFAFQNEWTAKQDEVESAHVEEDLDPRRRWRTM